MLSIENVMRINKTYTTHRLNIPNGETVILLSNDNDSSRCPQNLQLNSKYLLSNVHMNL